MTIKYSTPRRCMCVISRHIEPATCTYVNNKLDYKEVKLKTNFNEYIAIDVKFNDNGTMLLVNIYRGGSSGEDNSKELNKMLKEISNLKYHHTVIGGDVNYKDIGSIICVYHRQLVGLPISRGCERRISHTKYRGAHKGPGFGQAHNAGPSYHEWWCPGRQTYCWCTSREKWPRCHIS